MAATTVTHALHRLQSVVRREGTGLVLDTTQGSSATALSTRGSTAVAHARRPITTPGGIRVAAVALLLGLVVLGAVTLRAATKRQTAADRVAESATPLLVDAEGLYHDLADADAAVSTAFLRAGLEPSDLRQRYLKDIASAGTKLASIAGQPELTARAQQSVVDIGKSLPRYTGLIDSARANNRLGYPVGAAYLRQASDLMLNTILPAATTVYDEAARQLDARQRAGTSRSAVLGVLGAGAIVVILLAATQLFVTLRTRRLVNLWLVGATAAVVALGVWALVAFASQRQSLVESRRAGSDPLIALSTARILALRSLSDQNLDLIERGTEKEYLEDFDIRVASISGSKGEPGLLDTAAASAPDESFRDAIRAISTDLDDYVAIHDRVVALDDAGSYHDAVSMAMTEQAGASAALDDAFSAQIEVARDRLGAGAARAGDAGRWLPIGVVLLAAAAVGLAVAGLRVRLKEYQ